MVGEKARLRMIGKEIKPVTAAIIELKALVSKSLSQSVNQSVENSVK